MFLKKFMFVAVVAIIFVVVGCSRTGDQGSSAIVNPATTTNPIDTTQTNGYNGDFGEAVPSCSEFPTELPSGTTLEDLRKSLLVKADIPLEMLVPNVLEELSNSHSPEEYYIDSSGLHWGYPKEVVSQKALGSCYHPYGLSIVGSFHFVYWFSYRPPSYDAYMAWIPIYAQPYGSNGILVQKRDICWICGCNPICALLWTWICAK